MGSPNFCTNDDIIFNVAIDGFSYQDNETGEWQYDDFSRDEAKESLEEFINQLPTLWFHSVKYDTGYHEGFQLMLKEEININEVVRIWEQYREFSDIEGYDAQISDCPYFQKNAVNITKYTLEQAIKRECKLLIEIMTDFAKDNGFGKVVGKSWTSSVDYNW